ncbi:MAG: AhpC/TSA family protein [Saprospiraceae bacterium]|nr:AhpC/TSA family protein [Saprospiraceae bacterium]
MKYISLLTIAALFAFSACKSKVKGYQVTGEIVNANGQVLLQKLGPGSAVIDTATMTDGGQFEMAGALNEPGLFRIMDNTKRGAIVFLEKGSALNMNIDFDNPTEYTVEGNDESQSIKTFTAFANGQRTNPNFVQELKDKIRLEPSPYVAMLMVGSLRPSAQEKAFYNELADRFELEIPDSEYSKDFLARVEQINNIVVPPSIGEDMRNLTGESPDGQVYSLMDLKGKYVLLDFWAGWCGPCRRENPNVVAAYKKYKDKGFVVFNVSLDSDKNRWVSAIEQDNLDWPYHISDLRKWSSPLAKEYGVGSIPASFLIGPDGKIVGQNLRGPRLHETLDQLLGS